MGAGNLRILVDEDDPDALHGASAGLEALGAEVTRAATGAALIAELIPGARGRRAVS